MSTIQPQDWNDMPTEFDDYILGESDESILLDSSASCNTAVVALTRQAVRSLDIFSHKLDHRIYNNQAMYTAALKLATHSRYSQIRIILKDSSDVVKRGSRLIELYHRLSSRIHIRKSPAEYRDFPEEYVIADEVGLLRRRIATRYEAELCFYEPKLGRQLTKFFDECWEKSATDPDLRHLQL